MKSNHGECSCACNDNSDCVAFAFRDDNKICYFYVDVSELNEINTDRNCNTYIKNSHGNDSMYHFQFGTFQFKLECMFSLQKIEN